MAALDSLLTLGFEPAVDVASSPVSIDRHTVRFHASRPSMGTLVTLTLVGGSGTQVEAAAAAAFAELDRLVALLSRRDAATPLALLNAAGRLTGAPPELAALVGRSLAWHVITQGVFDVTVLPVVGLFEAYASDAAPSLPGAAELREARALVGAEHVTQEGSRLTLGRSGMALTLDGIAKGFIADSMAAAVERHGVRRYLVDAGGDLRVRGKNHLGTPWRIAVHHPDGGPFADVIAMTRGAVATSGSYVRCFDAAEEHHHLIDPLRGGSPTECRSVSVVAPNATDADALATSVFLMGPRAGCRFIDQLAGCACLVQGRHGETWRSRGWRGASGQTTEEIS